MVSERSQRWRQKRDAWVPNSSVIDPRNFSVDVVNCYRTAKPFIEEHHYSGTMPAWRASIGLFENSAGGRSALVGICTFSVPINSASMPLHAGVAPNQGVDLGRLVLLDHIGANGESYFVARAFRLLRQLKPEIISVLAYSDPIRRVSPTGQVILPGHVGQIYGALGAAALGRSSARTDFLLPNGRLLSPRAAAKIRAQDTGSAYAERQIIDAGGSRRNFAEDPADWLKRLEAQGQLLRRRHPGNHLFRFCLTRAAKLAAKDKPGQPHPQLDRSVTEGDVTALPLMAAA